MGWAGRPIFVTDVRTLKHPKVNPNPIDLGRNDGTIDYSHDVQVDDMGIGLGLRPRRHVRVLDGRAALRPDPRRQPHRVSCTTHGGRSATTLRTRATATTLIYATEEEFAGGSFPNGCANDGPLFISRPEGSYNGEGWRSTPSNKFRLKTVATWHPFGKQGSSTRRTARPTTSRSRTASCRCRSTAGLAVPRHQRPDREY